jgi:hypothetical protein
MWNPHLLRVETVHCPFCNEYPPKWRNVKPINNIFNLELDIKTLLQNSSRIDAGNSELSISITTA